MYGTVVADVVKGQYFRVALLGEDSKVKEALTRLAEHTENERGMVLALTHSSIKRTEKGVEGLESSTKKIEQVVEGMTVMYMIQSSKIQKRKIARFSTKNWMVKC